MLIRQLLLLLSCQLFCSFLIGQNTAQSLLKEAQKLSDEGAYNEAALKFSELADFWKNQNQRDSFYFYQYKEASHYSSAYQFEKAGKLLDDLIMELEGLDDLPSFLGMVYYNSGSNAVYLNQFDKALTELEKTLQFEQSRPIPDSLYLAKATEWKGLTYSYLGDLQKAQQLIRKALQIRYSVLEDRASEIGYNLNSLGIIEMELNNLRNADTAFSLALDILSEHLPSHHAHLSSISANISSIKSSLGEFGLAKELLEQSISSHIQGKRAYPLINDYFNLGALFLSLDDYEHAQPYILRAIELADSILPYPYYDRANLLDGLGGMYYSQGKYQQADSIFQISLKEKLLLFEPDHPEVGRSYYSLGMMAKEKKNYASAQKFFNRSYQIRKKSLGEQNPVTADVKYAIAELDWENGQLQKAIQVLRETYSTYLSSLGPINQSTIQNAFRLALLFEETDQADSIRNYLHLSWAAILGKEVKRLDFQNLAANEIQFADSYVLNIIEFHLRHLNQLKESFNLASLEEGHQILLLMDQLLEKILPLLHFENTNQNLTASIQRVFQEGILLASRGMILQPENSRWQNLMLYSLEKSKDIPIRSALQNRNALTIANVPDSIIEKDRKIREKLRFIKAQSDGEVQDLFFENLETWRDYQNSLKMDYPEWYDLRYAVPVPELKKIQQKLSEEEASLLVYFDLDTSLAALIIDKEKFKFLSLSIPDSWPDSVGVYHAILAKPTSSSRIANLGFRLYQYLWEPLKDELHSNVLIIPDGVLHYLNFETLLTTQAEGQNFADWNWLIKDYHIFYKNKLPEIARDKQRRGSEILSVAPGFSASLKEQYIDALPEDMEEDTLFTSWIRTPWSLSFAEKIGKKGKALLGAEASKSSFLKYASKAGILHFGTHAQLKDKDPLLSYLALSPEPKIGEEGYLYAYELYNLPLEAQMAVLTACQTGLGEYREGQGVISLAHAFKYAGCPSVVYSLWSIDDQQSNFLMDLFYQNLDQGDKISVALRKAKLEYLNLYANELALPYYWGGMILIGENDPVNPSSGFWGKYWWVFFMLLMGFVFLYFYRKK